MPEECKCFELLITGGVEMDEIRIENLKVFANHGVYKEEQENGQNFYINAVLYGDTRKAGVYDELEDSTNYGEVCHFINRFVSENVYKLIETVAEKLAREILTNFPLVKALDLEVRKPHAPIGLPFQSVSVKIHRAWHQVYVAFGSNMGNREAHIERGLALLNSYEGVIVEKASDIICTTPYGGIEQEEFLNGVASVKTYLSPWELLDVLHEVEASEKRERTLHWGPRTLDLDIIFFDNLILDEDELCIPHIDMQNREFVLKPMMELAPYKRHPVTGKSVQEMLTEFNGK